MTAAPLAVHNARRRYVVVGVIAPLVITAIAVVLMLAWLPDVPATVATHWSGDDGPTGSLPRGRCRCSLRRSGRGSPRSSRVRARALARRRVGADARACSAP